MVCLYAYADCCSIAVQRHISCILMHITSRRLDADTRTDDCLSSVLVKSVHYSTCLCNFEQKPTKAGVPFSNRQKLRQETSAATSSVFVGSWFVSVRRAAGVIKISISMKQALTEPEVRCRLLGGGTRSFGHRNWIRRTSTEEPSGRCDGCILTAGG